MSNLNLRTITNSFQDVRLVSLASWRQAREITPRDQGGPYVVMQEGYDPADVKMEGNEFVLGRSGKWLPLGHFYRLPVAERRQEFIFGTAAEVMQMMSNLPSKAQMLGRTSDDAAASPPAEDDEMTTALKAAKSKGGAAS
jgi:hypothetical protein